MHSVGRAWPELVADEAEPDEAMSRLYPVLEAALAVLPSDLLVPGAHRENRPTFRRLAKRADPGRRVVASARFSEPGLRERMEARGIDCRSADLTDAGVPSALRDALDLFFTATRKFVSLGNGAWPAPRTCCRRRGSRSASLAAEAPSSRQGMCCRRCRGNGRRRRGVQRNHRAPEQGGRRLAPILRAFHDTGYADFCAMAPFG